MLERMARCHVRRRGRTAHDWCSRASAASPATRPSSAAIAWPAARPAPAVDVSVHPDPRAQALLEQVRERELEQAVARLRLVHRDRPATVYLLSNIPLNLEVTTVTTWNALARDREAEACHRWAGVWLASASERAKAAPDLWATAEAAETDGGGGKGYANPSNYNLEGLRTPFSAYPGWHLIARHHAAVTLVEYRYPGQRGSAHKAFVPGHVWCDEAARANLEAVTGPVASVTIVRTVHREPIVDTGEPEPLTCRSRSQRPSTCSTWTKPGRSPATIASAGRCTTASGWSCPWPWRAGSRWPCEVQPNRQCSPEARHERARHRTIEPGHRTRFSLIGI